MCHETYHYRHQILAQQHNTGSGFECCRAGLQVQRNTFYKRETLTQLRLWSVHVAESRAPTKDAMERTSQKASTMVFRMDIIG